MARYKELPITSGAAYVRARTVTCDNPLDGNPLISFREQRVVDDGVGTLSVQDIGDFRAEMSASNVATEFQLVDADNVPTGGTMTYQQVYGILQSLYMHLARQRDASGL